MNWQKVCENENIQEIMLSFVIKERVKYVEKQSNNIK